MNRPYMKASGFTPWPQEMTQKYRDAGFWTQQTIPEMLEASAQRYSECVALVAGDQQWTYQALVEQVDKLAAGFQHKLNLKSGDKAVLHLPNVGEFYLSFFALLKIGVQPVLALPAHRYSEIRYFCHFTEAKVLITAPQLGVKTAEIAQQVAADLPSLKTVVWAGEESLMPIGAQALNTLFLEEVDAQSNVAEDFAFSNFLVGQRVRQSSSQEPTLITFIALVRAMTFVSSLLALVTYAFYLLRTISH